MPDTYLAVACAILLAALACLAIVAVNELRKERWAGEIFKKRYLRSEEEARRWEEAYYAKASQAEAYLGQIANYETICTNSGGGYVEKALRASQSQPRPGPMISRAPQVLRSSPGGTHALRRQTP